MVAPKSRPPDYARRAAALVIERLSARDMLGEVLAVAERFHVTITDLVGTARQRNITMARRHAWLALRERYNLSFPEIGNIFDRDHSTVVYGCRLAAHERARGIAQLATDANTAKNEDSPT